MSFPISRTLGHVNECMRSISVQDISGWSKTQTVVAEEKLKRESEIFQNKRTNTVGRVGRYDTCHHLPLNFSRNSNSIRASDGGFAQKGIKTAIAKIKIKIKIQSEKDGKKEIKLNTKEA